MKRLFTCAVAAAFSAPVVITATAPLAHADPYDCVTRTSFGQGYGICYAGTGTYRVTAMCDVNNRPDYRVYGKEVGTWNWSTSYCSGADKAYQVSIQVMSY